MPIGDIKSREPGTGARYNDGKPDLALVPLSVAHDLIFYAASLPQPETEIPYAHTALRYLGKFQQSGPGDARNLFFAARALYGSGPESMIDAIEEAAAVFSYGAKKYSPWNWAKGMPWTVPLACAARHVFAITRGEWDDPESKLPHRAHAMCNIMMLMYYMETYPAGNDLIWAPPPWEEEKNPGGPFIYPPSLLDPLPPENIETGAPTYKPMSSADYERLRTMTDYAYE